MCFKAYSMIVNIFKNVRIGHDNNDNKKIKKEGEVKYTLDETVRFWALKLKGHVSAKNTATISLFSTFNH